MALHVDLDNRIRRINKKLTDAAKFGIASETMQELNKAMFMAVRELNNDSQGDAKKSFGVIKGYKDPDSGKEIPVIQIRRVKELEQIDPYKLDAILSRVEEIGGIGTETREIRARLRKEGKEVTPKEIKKELKKKYNDKVEYMTKVQVLYEEVLKHPEHFLWAETDFVFSAYIGRGKPTREGVEHVNRLYNQHTMWKDGLYDPIEEGYSWEMPEYK